MTGLAPADATPPRAGRGAGRTWVHLAVAATARFVVDLRIGPRTLEMARQLVAGVALHCQPGEPLTLLADDHRPYPQAILSAFGQVRHRRRRRGRGRRKHPDLKPPPGLQVGIVTKVRDASGKLLEVAQRALFGSRQAIRKQLAQLGLGRQVHTSYVERLNGTLRAQQTRLARKTQNVSRREDRLLAALRLWRDWYHWVRPHASLKGRTPAEALGLTDHAWSVREYVLHPVHVGAWERQLRAETWENLLTNGLYREKPLQPLPTS